MPFLLLMPSYNQARYIRSAVRSVLEQSDPDWELWIVDNSTDDTPEVMRQFHDPRIRFHHIPERMDPGTCLNWMLERVVGEQFSYVHTDNNLAPNYVGKMREALSEHPMGLAYCDGWVIDERGRRVSTLRRGPFDLPRLVSPDPLGVPFSATTALARQVGGFAVKDVADDVRFCASAYGFAHYVHIAEPLIEYRVHSSSRTEGAGGITGVHRAFAKMMPDVISILEKRGVLPPLQDVTSDLLRHLSSLDRFADQLWRCELSKVAADLWTGGAPLDIFFRARLLRDTSFPRSWNGRDSKKAIIGASGKSIGFFRSAMLHRIMRREKEDLKEIFKQCQKYLVYWALIFLAHHRTRSVTEFRIARLDFKTLWAAHQLELHLGLVPRLSKEITEVPHWLDWQHGGENLPLLDIDSARIVF